MLEVQHVVQAGEHRLGEPRVPLVALRSVRGDEQPRDVLAHLGRVAVAGDEDEARHEPAVRLAMHEQAHPAPLLQPQDAHRGREEMVDVDLEEVVARIRLEDLHEILLVVARRQEPGPLDDGRDLPAQHRHVERAAGVRARRVQPDEPVLADDLAVRVVPLDPDVVEVRRAVHRRARVRLVSTSNVFSCALARIAFGRFAKLFDGRSGASRNRPRPLPGTGSRRSSSVSS